MSTKKNPSGAAPVRSFIAALAVAAAGILLSGCGSTPLPPPRPSSPVSAPTSQYPAPQNQGEIDHWNMGQQSSFEPVNSAPWEDVVSGKRRRQEQQAAEALQNQLQEALRQEVMRQQAQQQAQQQGEYQRFKQAAEQARVCFTCGGAGAYRIVDGNGMLQVRICPKCNGSGRNW